MYTRVFVLYYIIHWSDIFYFINPVFLDLDNTAMVYTASSCTDEAPRADQTGSNFTIAKGINSKKQKRSLPGISTVSGRKKALGQSYQNDLDESPDESEFNRLQ